jgi:hypothetical protein
LVPHVERLTGTEVVSWHPVTGGGWSIARRGVFKLKDGRQVFAKLGDVAGTAQAIREEIATYGLIEGPFVPTFVAADASVPVLVIEDLSDAVWPPPWTPELLRSLDALLDQMALTRAHPRLPSLGDHIAENRRV